MNLEKGMNRTMIITVLGSIAVINSGLMPLYNMARSRNSVETMILDHEESIVRIGTKLAEVNEIQTMQTVQLNSLIDFANSGERFTAQDGNLLKAQIDSLASVQQQDKAFFSSRIDELKTLIKDLQLEIRSFQNGFTPNR